MLFLWMQNWISGEVCGYFGVTQKGGGSTPLGRARLFPDPYFVSPVAIEESYILDTEMQGWTTLPEWQLCGTGA
jgi:hypothetical protein